MKYHIWTIGCQYNEWDATRLDFLMQKMGFLESKPTDADVIIILACAVRQTAVDRIFGQIKNWNFPRPTPHSSLPTILITGCVLEPDKKMLAQKGVEFFESGDFDQLNTILSSKLNLKLPLSSQKLKKISPNPQPSTPYSLLPIMSGCNNFCSYCAVPYTRGREKSRPMKEILAEAKILIEQGCEEIILLGQNVNSYRMTFPTVIPQLMRDPEKVDSRLRGNDKGRSRKHNEKTDFTVLLEKLNELDGDFVVSFMSNHPKDMTDDIIEAVATLPKIKKEIHLPLQSGSDKILREMNRPYTIQRYLGIVDNLKFKIQNLKLTTDVIVGFPGESKEDFDKTVEIFKLVNFDAAYINKYSPRKGTKAFELGDPILWSEKQRRWRLLNEIVNKK